MLDQLVHKEQLVVPEIQDLLVILERLELQDQMD